MSYTNPADFIEEQDPGTSLEVVRDDTAMHFRDFESLLATAEGLSDYLAGMAVNERSEKDIKKILANVRKLETAINDRKKAIKAAVMAPYTVLELEAKQLISTIQCGENAARDKLKAIDLKRKEDKMEQIEDIWDLRQNYWMAGKYFNVEDFVTPKHLNQTVSLSSVEKDMVEFFQQTSKDLIMILEDPNATELLVEYKKTKNLAETYSIVNERHRQMEKLTDPAAEPFMIVRITGKADCILAKQLLCDVNYKIIQEG